MNRIQLAAHEAPAAAQSAPQVQDSILRTAARHGLQHTLFVPMHYERNYAYPLLVWLHGPSDDERQLQRVMPLVSMRNYVGVGPRGCCSAGRGSDGFRWAQTDDAILAAEYSVFECIESACEKFNIARSRIFLAGYECGGTMAFRVALRNPQKFAGALSVCGPFPDGNMPLRNLEQVRRVPLFIAHGRDARKYTVECICQELRLFHAAGLSATLRQYPCGDELTTTMLHDMDVWIMEHVTGVVSSSGDEAHPWHEAN
jgi:phospholipase/carboxylesterase